MGYDKEKVYTAKFLIYELLGTSILTICYNMTGQYVYFLLVVSVWAWNYSAAHFNAAITLGELVVRSQDGGEFMKGLVPFGAIAMTQIIGGLLGILITFMISQITYGTNSKTISPTPPTLCPALGCKTDYLHWLVFCSELIASFGVVLSFLIVRFSDFGAESKKWMGLVGPFVVALAINGCNFLNNTMSNGTMNPSLAFEVLVWSLGAYNQMDNQATYPDQTRFTYSQYGRYAWAYLVAPLVAGLLAGFIARFHLKAQSEHSENDAKVFEEK